MLLIPMNYCKTGIAISDSHFLIMFLSFSHLNYLFSYNYSYLKLNNPTHFITPITLSF